MTKNDDLKKKNALKSYQNLHHTRSCENSPILENIITAISEKYIYSIRSFTFNEFTLSWVFVVNIRMHDANTCTQYLIITIWTHHWRPPLPPPPPFFIKRGLEKKLELISVSSLRLELCIRAVNIMWCHPLPGLITHPHWQLIPGSWSSSW